MKGTDKFLVGIVVGALVLVAVGLGLAMTRPDATYMAEDTPEGVVNNYLLALTEEDYERAYGYLSPSIPGYPKTALKFEQDLSYFDYRYSNSQDVNLEIVEVKVNGDDAIAKVRQTRYYQGDLFSSGQDTVTFILELVFDGEEWKIARGEDYYFSFCWTLKNGCR